MSTGDTLKLNTIFNDEGWMIENWQFIPAGELEFNTLYWHIGMRNMGFTEWSWLI